MVSSTKTMTSPDGRSGWGGLCFTVFFPGHFTRAHLTTRRLLRGRRAGGLWQDSLEGLQVGVAAVGGGGARAVKFSSQETQRNFLSGMVLVVKPFSRKLRCVLPAV